MVINKPITLCGRSKYLAFSIIGTSRQEVEILNDERERVAVVHIVFALGLVGKPHGEQCAGAVKAAIFAIRIDSYNGRIVWTCDMTAVASKHIARIMHRAHVIDTFRCRKRRSIWRIHKYQNDGRQEIQ